MKRLLVLFCLSVTACGGGGGGGSDSGAVYATDLANKLGCQDVTVAVSADRQMFVADQGECTFGGAKVELYRFTTNAARDNWIKVASEFGARVVAVDRGVVDSDDQSAIDRVKAKIGGTIRTS